MEAAGIEPASRDVSVRISTCVADCLIFTEPPPVDRVRTRLAENFFDSERARHGSERSGFGDRPLGLSG